MCTFGEGRASEASLCPWRVWGREMKREASQRARLEPLMVCLQVLIQPRWTTAGWGRGQSNIPDTCLIVSWRNQDKIQLFHNLEAIKDKNARIHGLPTVCRQADHQLNPDCWRLLHICPSLSLQMLGFHPVLALSLPPVIEKQKFQTFRIPEGFSKYS